MPDNPYVLRIEAEIRELHDENQKLRLENKKQFDQLLEGQQQITKLQSSNEKLEAVNRRLVNMHQ